MKKNTADQQKKEGEVVVFMSDHLFLHPCIETSQKDCDSILYVFI